MNRTVPGVIRFGAYIVDLSAGQLYKHGTRINLRDKSFQVLSALLENPGQVVTREELRQRLWSDEVFVDFDNNLNTAVARLREALGDSAEQPRYIETLHKRGYRFLEDVFEQPQDTKRTTKRAKLVVLPFLNLSGDQSQEYFSDAVTDEIITAMATLAPEKLAVIARTTAMHFKGGKKDVAQIGRELNVDYVLEGGVRRNADRVGINLQLIQVSDQTHLFANRYDAALRDLFDVQDSIAQALGARLNITPPPAKAGGVPHVGRARRRPTEDLAAYDAYILGRYHLCRWTPDEITMAKQLLEEAIARDSQFALAYDALAEIYWWIGFLGMVRPKDAFSAGVFCALRAIEIDDTLAEAHSMLGTFRKELDYDWPEVQREMAQALELDSGSPAVRFRYALSGLMPLGRLDEAVEQMESVLESDPLSPLMRAWLCAMLYFGRRYEESVEQLRVLIELDPSYYLGYLVLGQVRSAQGAFGEAIASLRKAAALSGNAPLVLGWLGMTLAMSGNTIEAQEVLAGLHAAAAQTYVPPTSFAWIHLGLGEIDYAFTWMDRAIEERDPIIVPIRSFPFLDPLRTDLRFAGLLRRMKLESSALNH